MQLKMLLAFINTGHSVNDDILIIIGATKVGENPSKHLFEVQEAMIKLLKNELGLEALPAITRFAPSDTAKLQIPILSNLNIEALPVPRENALPTTMEFQTRRPAVLQRLKVTKKSLYRWLQRKVSVK